MSWKNRIPVVLIAFIVSCNIQQEEINQELFIRGQFSNFGNSVVFLEELTTGDVITLDSIITDGDGSFRFSKDLYDAGFFIIRLEQGDQITLLAEPGEDIHLAGDAQQLVVTYTVKGSAGSALLAELNKKLWYNRHMVDSLVRIYRERKYDPGAMELRNELEAFYWQVFAEQQSFVKSFIEQNPHSLASLIALHQYFGRRLLLKESEHLSYFELLSKSLTEEYPNNKHVMELNRRLSEYMRNEKQRILAEESLRPGLPAPEIVLPDPHGKQIALSSLRGNYVLIDFWAAWCPPCRKANAQLKEIYEQFHPLGFEIFSVSLDRTLDQWKLGIEEDKIDWIQVSDLRFWNSPVVRMYNVESIPHMIMLDRDGKIIQKGLKVNEGGEILGRLLE